MYMWPIFVTFMCGINGLLWLFINDLLMSYKDLFLLTL